jgi:hypothetical protein
MSCSIGLKYKKGMRNPARSLTFVMGQLYLCLGPVEMPL